MARGFRTWVFLAFLAPLSVAAVPRPLPECLDKDGRPISSPNNEEVLRWKTSTPNQYHDRALVAGTLVGVFSSKGDHLHLDVFLGQGAKGTGRDSDIEVVYNTAFGNVDEPLRPGMEVVACGDYITATDRAGRYPPSPVGAILHWVHKRMRGDHPHGFMMIDGTLYGQKDAPPRGGQYRGFFGEDAWGLFFPALAY